VSELKLGVSTLGEISAVIWGRGFNFLSPDSHYKFQPGGFCKKKDRFALKSPSCSYLWKILEE